MGGESRRGGTTDGRRRIIIRRRGMVKRCATNDFTAATHAS